MKGKIFLIKFIAGAAIFSVVYISNIYEFPQSQFINNQAKYYLSHNSDIQYITTNAYNNAKVLIEIIYEQARSEINYFKGI